MAWRTCFKCVVGLFHQKGSKYESYMHCQKVPLVVLKMVPENQARI